MKPKVHLLTLVVLTVVAGLLLWLNMRPFQITKREIVGDWLIVHYSFPQFPIGTEYTFRHVPDPQNCCPHPEDTLERLREQTFLMIRPDLAWNIPICVALLIVTGVLVEIAAKFRVKRRAGLSRSGAARL